MPWDMEKCQWGVPEEFTNEQAQQAVENADFVNAVYVKTSETTDVTKKAFTYYFVGDYRICVVGDVHRENTQSPWVIAGNSYIPGWKNWETPTPEEQVAEIGPLADGGTFPTDNRYPHPV